LLIAGVAGITNKGTSSRRYSSRAHENSKHLVIQKRKLKEKKKRKTPQKR